MFSRDVDYAEGVLLFVVKSVAENKLYIHNMNLQNKNETVSLNAKDKISRGYNNNDLSRTDNIANNVSNVNNTDTKFSRDVNIDEFDERDYNVINTTGLRGYASLKHEVMTWDDIKYLNQVRCISIEDRFYLYKMLDNETRDVKKNKE